MRHLLSILIVLLACRLEPLLGQDLVGAKQALADIQTRAAAFSKKKQDTIEEVESILEKLRKQVATLPPEEAASQWLALYDVWASMPFDEATPDSPDRSFGRLLLALPHPDAWKELSRQIDLRQKREQPMSLRDWELSLFGHRLISNKKAVLSDIQRLEQLLKPEGAQETSQFASINWTLKSQLNSLEQLKAYVVPTNPISEFRSAVSDPANQSILIPTLDDISATDAKALIAKALARKNFRIVFSKPSPATTKLVREVVREKLNDITIPIWDICHSFDSADLYEAFLKLDSNSDSWGQTEASYYYVVGLILNDRGDDVVTLFKNTTGNDADRFDQWGVRSDPVVDALERVGKSKSAKVFKYLVTTAGQHPDFPFWQLAAELGSRLGRHAEVTQALQSVLAKEQSPELRETLQDSFAEALLIDDRIPEAVKVYTELISTNTPKKSKSENRYSQFEIAMKIAQIGHLLKNDAWFSTGQTAAEKLIASYHADDEFDPKELTSLLIERGRLADAERILIQGIARQAVQNDEDNVWNYHGGAHGNLDELARVYHHAKRPKDVLSLLELAPWWYFADIHETLDEVDVGDRRLPISLIAARALYAEGHTEQARKICEAIILHEPGFDPAWELAMEIMQDEFPDYALRVFQRDQFEERPLIWVGSFFLKKNGIIEAEKLIRKAIAIDPSDGEQGPNNRMRVYAVLADILEKKNDPKTAKVYRGAVRAIRLSETADRFHEAGMHTRGIRMYAESLKQFADAYCIQSRLAVQYAALGNLERAAIHYQRAFELMPSSFGRVESHCFGCEGAFNGKLAQSIANRVFTRLLANDPANPRLQYLMGYLRWNQDLYPEAVKFLREAVRLDPDYLNAWKKLRDTIELAGDEASNDSDEILGNLFRLDPEQRHTYVDVTELDDLAVVWRLLEKQPAPVKTETLFELTARKAAFAEAKKKSDGNYPIIGINDAVVEPSGTALFATHDEVAAIVSLIDQSRPTE
jgi:tetratricopeptide (TPR) repeat protein